MNKKYYFLILIIFMLTLLYVIIKDKYLEYKVINDMTQRKIENQKIESEIEKNKKILKYLNTNAYKDKILKDEQGLKNKGEDVIFLTTDKKFTKYTKNERPKINNNEKKEIYNNMNIIEKWFYILFKKDIR